MAGGDVGAGGPLMYQNLRRLINVIDELRDVGLQQYVNLPRICVVGTQSAGKSSVLEAVVGMDFLPRGDGVVTRRPLELRLVHDADPQAESWAKFDALPNAKFTDFQQVRLTIERLTEEVAGANKGIVDDPIVLTVRSPKCPDLTLIDLPGITRMPMRGSDQGEDIEKITRDMATRYAKDPRTLILAVCAANADMSTSDALPLARRVDPKGVRTIGVLTKIDLMDRGTDAARMLRGEDVHLRLGFTGVRNRSQQEIRENKTIEDALKTEAEFFNSHPVYRLLPKQMIGTQSLIEKLTRVLFRHIRTYLPDIKREISNRMHTVENRLQELGTGVPTEAAAKVQLMWSMVTDYCEIFRSTIRGKFDKKLQMYFEHSDVLSGAQIRQVFNDLLQELAAAPVTKDLSDYDIDLAIRMHEGDSLPGFPSPDTFEYLIVPHLQKIAVPVMDCLDQVTQSLEALLDAVANRVFGRFPQLREAVLDQSAAIVAREKERARQVLEDLVAAETGYLYTNDTSYLTEHGSMVPIADPSNAAANAYYVPPQQQQQPGPLEDHTSASGGAYGLTSNAAHTVTSAVTQGASAVQQASSALYNSVQGAVASVRMPNARRPHYSATFLREIRNRLDAYFRIVIRNVRDTVPKAIGYFLVRALQEKLQFELYNELNSELQMQTLLGEPLEIMEERGALRVQMDVLRKAAQVLQRDPSLALVSEFDEDYDRDLAQLRAQNLVASLNAQSHVPPAVTEIALPQGSNYPTAPPQSVTQQTVWPGAAKLWGRGTSKDSLPASSTVSAAVHPNAASSTPLPPKPTKGSLFQRDAPSNPLLG